MSGRIFTWLSRANLMVCSSEERTYLASTFSVVFDAFDCHYGGFYARMKAHRRGSAAGAAASTSAFVKSECRNTTLPNKGTKLTSALRNRSLAAYPGVGLTIERTYRFYPECENKALR